MESDFLLMVLRDLLGRKPDLTLVLMSATLDADLFSRYFAPRHSHALPKGGARPKPPPTVRVPGRTFPVTCLFLEDALELTGHKVKAGADWAKKAGGGKGGGKGGGGGGGKGCGGGVGGKGGGGKGAKGGGGGRGGGGRGDGGGDGSLPLDGDLSEAELALRYPGYSGGTTLALSQLADDQARRPYACTEPLCLHVAPVLARRSCACT